MMAFTLRYLEAGDCEWLRCLRNESRDAFFDHREITPEQQAAWFRACPWGDQRWVIEDRKIIHEPAGGLLGMGSSERVGYFSIVAPKPDLPVFPTDGRQVRYFNAMMVAAEHRGQGAILAATAAFDTASHCYVGYVAEGNYASLRACTKLGFEDRGRYKHPVYGYIHIVWRG